MPGKGKEGGRYSPTYVWRQRVGFFSRFGHKQDIDFGHFGYKLGMVLAL